MDLIFINLGRIFPVIYIALALGALFSTRYLLSAWREWRESYFGLEREIAMRKLSKWIGVTVLILVVACAEFSIITFVVPGLPASALLATPTLNILGAPTSLAPVTTLNAQGTPVAVATIAGSAGCVPGRLEITSPRPGAEVSGIVEIIGSVDVGNFGFYKYEISLPGSDIWATIYAASDPHKNETLGSLNTSVFTPGDYLLRLVVTDNKGLALTPCIIPIRIKGQ